MRNVTVVMLPRTQEENIPHPAMLTLLIKKACGIEALLRTYSIHKKHANHIHVTAFWISLARLAGHSAGRYWLQKTENGLEPLAQHTLRAASVREIDARGVANIAYGAACCCRRESLDALLVVLAKIAEKRANKFRAQELANTAWAFATAGQSNVNLFMALAEASQQRMPDFNTQELANTAWAFATVGQINAKLFTTLASTASRRASNFRAQGLANILWAFAKANQSDMQLRRAA